MNYPMTILLQIAEPAPELTSSELTVAELIMKGGVVMIPIVFLLCVATYFFIERFLYIRSVTKKGKGMMVQIKKYLQDGDIKSAKMFANQEASAVGNVIAVGLDY